MYRHDPRQTYSADPPFLQLPPPLRSRIYSYVLPTGLRISSFANSSTSGFHNPMSVMRVCLTCRRINEEALAFYYSNNGFMLLVNYGAKIYYPLEAHIQAITRISQLRSISNLIVEIMVGHGPALRGSPGYRYVTRDTQAYLDLILNTLEEAKEGVRGLLLQTLTLVDHEGRVPLLMQKYAEETGTEVNEVAIYKPLVDLVRGRMVGRLAIESNQGRLRYDVDL